MTKRNLVYRFVLPTTALSFILVSGCGPESDKQTANPNSMSAESATPEGKLSVDVATMDTDEEHGHIPGAHGGIMVSLGRDSYHVEAVVDSEGSIRLYTLGQDESRVIEVESQTLNGFVKAEGDADSKAIAFTPSPQDGDSEGKTSLFVGRLPADLVGRKLDVTIPNIRINGERFRLGFVSGQDGHDDEPVMPTKVADGAEQELYLTAGGRYTAADIAANGNVTASQKFKGIKSAHDMKPKVGDMLCPISGTKANPKFTWIIDGKPYEFCCPPCIDEFLASAKESNEPIPNPESFIKQ
ncbi:hypothetical protein SH449x_003767 [Pirellulaceae bacterium SH449]